MGCVRGSPLVTESSRAVFLSYASQDVNAARRICDALRAAGIEVWFDQSELRGGEAWDQAIRKQIKACALFIPVISANAHARVEGYFRLEWKLAVDRSHLIAPDQPFLLPVVIDETSQDDDRLPDRFRELQWARLPGGETPPAFIERVRRLLSPREIPRAGRPDPSGDHATSPVPAIGRSIHRFSTSRRAMVLAAAVTVVAVAYLAIDKLGLPNRSVTPREGTAAPVVQTLPAAPTTISGNSIAVLPFADMSEKKDQEYFADGLSEEILNLLAGVPTLSIVGRTSSFQFKGQNGDLRAIGAKLGAAYVLEGSVRRAGDRVRVTAQLVSTRDGTHRWSHTYERPFGDVLKLQDELAAGVARAMEVTVDSDALQSHGVTNNPAAYDFYLRGLHSMERYDREGFETGANYFQQALDLDPNFAAAATQLGRMVLFQAEFGFAPAGPTYARARQTLETAIRLDPRSGQAHAWLGWVYTAYDWNWAAADHEMQSALRFAPRDPVVHLCAARLAAALGHWDEAAGLLSSGLARDPLYAAGMNSLSEVYARTGRLQEAEAAERRVLEISPTYSSGPRNLAVILLATGRREEALNVVTNQQQENVDRAQALTLIYHDLGRKAESDEQLAALVRQYANDEAFEIAEAYAYRGQREEAFRWLERAFNQKDPGLYFIQVSLLLGKLEGDPRYKAFLRKLRLPQ